MLDIVNVEYFTEEGVEYKKETYNNGTTVVTPVPQPSVLMDNYGDEGNQREAKLSIDTRIVPVG